MTIPEFKISVRKEKGIITSDLISIKSSADIAALCKQMFDADTFDWTEEFIIICLNRSNRVTGYKKISSGGMTGTVADPRVILTCALNCMATSIILSHNHPSGNLRPSAADIAITERIKNAAQFLDISILDHVIISDQGHYSFADEGML